MRIVMDYRPALRARSGVGEYVHQTARALARRYPDDALTIFTSSWKDRPDTDATTGCPAAIISDHRVPVRALNFAWHWLEWPSIELVTHGRYDVAFSPHPLLLPAKHAVQVVMVHDLDFLRHRQRTQREIRRDYPRLAGPHARRASRVIVPSAYTAADVAEHLGVPRGRIVVCPPGAPDWAEPVPARFATDGYVLFVGTLEPRKNVAGLLEAYGRLLTRRPTMPPLIMAGAAGPDAKPWLDAIARPPLAGHVDYLGYVSAEDRQAIYTGARVLVLPSYEEGFGMPVLEAMSLGVPVVAARRGALPELVGNAGLLVEPDDPECIAAAVDRVLADDHLADSLSRRGLDRSRLFRWQYTAQVIHTAFQEAIDERRAGLTAHVSCRSSVRAGR
jgi:glycosyltransferase involved in cell wall biosynthesis